MILTHFLCLSPYKVNRFGNLSQYVHSFAAYAHCFIILNNLLLPKFLISKGGAMGY